MIDEDPDWRAWSLAALDEWSRRGPVLINPIISAEISPDFDHPAAFDAVLENVGIEYRTFRGRGPLNERGGTRCFF